MRNRSLLVVAATLVALSAASASAQVKRVQISLGSGFTAPNSEVRDHLGDGFNINFGVQVNVTPVIGIEGVYSFNGLGEKQITGRVADQPGLPSIDRNFFGDMNMQYGTFSLVFQKPEGQVRPYGVAGGGIYYRPIKVTTPGAGYVPGWCDPYWYVCYPGGWIPVDYIIGERSSTDFGMVFGAGANFNIVYAEMRYHYVWGPEAQIQTPVQPIEPPLTTGDRKANGQFLTFTFGLRF
jgi:hypothetical protein